MIPDKKVFIELLFHEVNIMYNDMAIENNLSGVNNNSIIISVVFSEDITHIYFELSYRQISSQLSAIMLSQFIDQTKAWKDNLDKLLKQYAVGGELKVRCIVLN